MVLRRHVDLARGKEVERELHCPRKIVLVPLTEDVLFKEMHKALGGLDDRPERNQDKGNREDPVQHAHGVRKVAAHDAAAERGHEHKQTGDRKKDAADGRNTVGHAGQKGVTLNIAGHLFLLIVLLP